LTPSTPNRPWRSIKQRKRLADAERKLHVKATKKATEDVRIANAKIEWGLGKLADPKRVGLESRDARIFPGVHVPVMVWKDGPRVVKPMRYQCRPTGKPAKFDALSAGRHLRRPARQPGGDLEGRLWSVARDQ
jgi:hypothetical protein